MQWCHGRSVNVNSLTPIRLQRRLSNCDLDWGPWNTHWSVQQTEAPTSKGYMYRHQCNDVMDTILTPMSSLTPIRQQRRLPNCDCLRQQDRRHTKEIYERDICIEISAWMSWAQCQCHLWRQSVSWAVCQTVTGRAKPWAARSARICIDINAMMSWTQQCQCQPQWHL